MQQGMMAPPRMGPAVWRYGLIFGGILALIGAGNAVLQLLVGGFQVITQASNGTTTASLSNNGPSLLLACVGLLLILGLTFVAGILAARACGKTGAGALAGLIAGALAGLIGSAASLLIVIFVVAPTVQAPPGSTLDDGGVQTLLIITNIAGAVFQSLCDLGIGAGLGAIGGLIGRSIYRSAHPAAYPPYPYLYAYQSPFYPGYPSYPGAHPPAQPGQPGAYPPPFPQPYAYPPTQPAGYPPALDPGTQNPAPGYSTYPGYAPPPSPSPSEPQ